MFSKRLAVIRSYMAESGIDTLLVSTQQPLFYLTGHFLMVDERLMALVITKDNALMLHNAVTTVPDVYPRQTYQDGEDALARLLPLLSGKVIGVDPDWASHYVLSLQALRPDLTFRAADCVRRARMFKDAREIELLQRSSAITDAVFAECLPKIYEGMTELDLSALFSEGFFNQGVGRIQGEALVCFGGGGAQPHHHTTDIPLRPGDPVMVDTGKRIDGYCSDMTRTVFFRHCGDEERRVYETVLAANLAALDRVRPGVTLGEIDQAARGVIEAAGYGAYFTHRTGHGIGIEGHEAPAVAPGSTVTAEPGMSFTIEPGIYLPGRFGVRIEDIVVVTEGGHLRLTQHPKELTILP